MSTINLNDIRPMRALTEEELKSFVARSKEMLERHARFWNTLSPHEEIKINQFPPDFGPVKIQNPLKIYNTTPT